MIRGVFSEKIILLFINMHIYFDNEAFIFKGYIVLIWNTYPFCGWNPEIRAPSEICWNITP